MALHQFLPGTGRGTAERRWRGFIAPHHAPSTMLRMVPLPINGEERG